jgi:recombinational DNA repair ATPase RecF
VLRQFRVQNFRGLHDLELSDLARVNVITGLNSVGKTAALEALYLYACGLRAAGGSALLAPSGGALRWFQFRSWI